MSVIHHHRSGLSFIARAVICIVVAVMPSIAVQAGATEGAGPTASGGSSGSYYDLFRQKKYKQAEAVLRRLVDLRPLSADIRWRLTVDLAKTQRYQGDGHGALKTLDQLSRSDRHRPMAEVESAWAHLLTKDRAAAQRDIDDLIHGKDAEGQCHGRYLVAGLKFKDERYVECIKQCKVALKSFGHVKLYHNPYDWELRRLRTNILKLMAEAKNRLIAQRYGDAYANYRIARFAQANEDYPRAIKYYQLVVASKAPILSDASGCYIGACLVSLGHIGDAATHWQSFIESDPKGLYRGEAMLGLGRMELLHVRNHSQLEQADHWLSKASTWDQALDGKSATATIKSIRKILKAFPLPKHRAVKDRFGNYYRKSVGPETIINRLTATWYLTDQRIHATLLHAFALIELGDQKNAAKAIDQVIQLGQGSDGILDLGDMPRRLAVEAKDGAFFVPPAIWKSLSPKYAMRLQLACYLLVAQQNHDAKQQFDAVYQAVHGHANHVLDWSVAQLGLAVIAFRSGGRNAALARLSTFENTLKHSPLAPLAVLWSANLYAGEAGGFSKAQKRYMWVVRQVPGSSLAPRALLSLAVAAANAGQDDLAQQACQRLLAHYPESVFAAAGRTLLRKFDGVHTKATPASYQPTNEPRGRIMPFDRHLVIPGDVDFTIDLGDYQAGDVLDYDISYTVRAGCALNHFWYSVNLDEPQPPAVEHSPLRFMRAPILVTAP